MIDKKTPSEQKSTKKSSSNNVEDKSSIFQLCVVEDSNNESRASFDEMLNDSLKMSNRNHNQEKSMEIIIPNLPQLNVNQLTIEPKCSLDEVDSIPEISLNISVSSFTSTILTNLEQSMEKTITDLSDLVSYFWVPKIIKNLWHQKKIDKRVTNKCKQTYEVCRGSSSDTTANKINPYYLIG